MKHLSELLERLELAESAYKSANSFLDGGSLQFILAKEELKQSRFLFDKLSAKLAKELVSNEDFLKEASRFINVEEY